MPRGGSKKGQRRGGRQKGSLNKITTEVKAVLTAVHAEIGGAKRMAEWAEENPGEFYKLWAKMLPTEIKNADGVFRVQNVTEVVVRSREEADAVLALNKADVSALTPASA